MESKLEVLETKLLFRLRFLVSLESEKEFFISEEGGLISGSVINSVLILMKSDSFESDWCTFTLGLPTADVTVLELHFCFFS